MKKSIRSTMIGCLPGTTLLAISALKISGVASFVNTNNLQRQQAAQLQRSSIGLFDPKRSDGDNSIRSISRTTTTTATTFFSTTVEESAATAVAATSEDAEDSSATGVVVDGLLMPEYLAAYKQAEQIVQETAKSAKPELVEPILHFVKEYLGASQASFVTNPELEQANAQNSLRRIMEGVKFGFTYGMGPNKYQFKETHDALRGEDGNGLDDDGNSIDFYTWGCDFFRYFIDIEKSVVMGQSNLEKALKQIENGDNVVFFANHQSEADPQVMSMLMEKIGLEKEAENIVFVAGHKVTTDALAVPFSMGRNLICIHSKKHIDADPDTKAAKNRQNLNAMGGMLGKLKQGGCALWVAPSGGRDRRDVTTGKMPIAPFDSKTIDMFRLMGNKSKKPTHYYPLAMVSYELCPPPDSTEAGTGEQRNFRFTPVGINVGAELESVGGLECRQTFNENAYRQTLQGYHQLRESMFPGTAPDLPPSSADEDVEESTKD